MWGKTVVLCGVLAVALAAVAKGPLQPKPEKFKDVEGCYLEDLDAVIPVGQSALSKSSCLQYRCYATSIAYVGCGSLDAGPGLKVVEDKTKPYPDCCPRVEEDTSTKSAE